MGLHFLSTLPTKNLVDLIQVEYKLNNKTLKMGCLIYSASWCSYISSISHSALNAGFKSAGIDIAAPDI